MAKITIEVEDSKVDSIKMGNYTVCKNIGSLMVWNGKWLICWNRVVKDEEVIKSIKGEFGSLQEAIKAVENVK